MYSMMIYIDGQFLPREQAKISVFDHGLLYGDGVFEGIRAYNGRIFRLDEHVDRLIRFGKNNRSQRANLERRDGKSHYRDNAQE